MPATTTTRPTTTARGLMKMRIAKFRADLDEYPENYDSDDLPRLLRACDALEKASKLTGLAATDLIREAAWEIKLVCSHPKTCQLGYLAMLRSSDYHR